MSVRFEPVPQSQKCLYPDDAAGRGVAGDKGCDTRKSSGFAKTFRLCEPFAAARKVRRQFGGVNGLKVFWRLR